jgi:hypothetical protein
VQRRDRAKEGKQHLEWSWCAHCTGMYIEILNCLGQTWEAEQGGVKRIRRGESTGAVTYAWEYHKETPCVVIFVLN